MSADNTIREHINNNETCHIDNDVVACGDLKGDAVSMPREDVEKVADAPANEDNLEEIKMLQQNLR